MLDELPALFLTGPRASGKTTTAVRHAATVVRLDRSAEAVAFRADPDAALRDLAEPVLLDEWQVVPGVIGAVKRAVDDDPRPGRFIVAGSVRGEIQGDLWRRHIFVIRRQQVPGSDPSVGSTPHA
jgi:predicted AAA+ superfamily ATPase